jgi:predicted RNase H-like HicB family nuclease
VNEARHYPAKVFWSGEDEGFIALAPDLPGCSAFGTSEGEAITELRFAIEAWIEAARRAGNAVPPPTAPHETDASGRLLLRLPKSLHRSLIDGATKEGVSVNQHLVSLLSMASAVRGCEAVVEGSFKRLFEQAISRAVVPRTGPSVVVLDSLNASLYSHPSSANTSQLLESLFDVSHSGVVLSHAGGVASSSVSAGESLLLEDEAEYAVPYRAAQQPRRQAIG